MGCDPNMGQDGAKNGSLGDPVRTVPCYPKLGKIQPFYGILILSTSYDSGVLFKYQAPCGMH